MYIYIFFSFMDWMYFEHDDLCLGDLSFSSGRLVCDISIQLAPSWDIFNYFVSIL